MPINSSDRFYDAVRAVPDFPEPGIVFRDITPLLADHRLFRQAVEEMAAPFTRDGVTKVVGIESRGFILGAPIALALQAGLVPLRKEGKLPRARRRVEYTLEYGSAALEIHTDAVGKDDRVLIVDDVLATGGTAAAACDAVTAGGAAIAGLSLLIELRALGGRARLAGQRVETLLGY